MSILTAEHRADDKVAIYIDARLWKAYKDAQEFVSAVKQEILGVQLKMHRSAGGGQHIEVIETDAVVTLLIDRPPPQWQD